MQTLNQKKGEVTFRRLITKQHLGQKSFFAHEYNHDEMFNEQKKRLRSTTADFEELKKRGVSFDTFLEIGAEYGLRSSFILSKYESKGIALDLARSPLEATNLFAKKLNLKKVPIRICADAHKLPFADNSVPLIFCYQTLHHFPNPLLVTAEVKRVLKPGGYFFFAEEPVRQSFNFRLYRRPTKQSGLNGILKKMLVLPFISEPGKNETDFGIVEETFSLGVWQNIINNFTSIEVTITPLLGKPVVLKTHSVNLKRQVPRITTLQLQLFGGGIKALVQKKRTKPIKRFTLQFTCPNCRQNLLQKNKEMYCAKCHTVFKSINGVWHLLPTILSKHLYPEL